MDDELKHILFVDEKDDWLDARHGRSFMSQGSMVYRTVLNDRNPEEVYREFHEFGATLIDHIAIPKSNIVQVMGFFFNNNGSIN